MDPDLAKHFEEDGEWLAARMKVVPKQVTYIEARGAVCQELRFLLGGYTVYVETHWREFMLKILEYIFPVSPICRWYPPGDSRLELVGAEREYAARAYRFKPSKGPPTVFFVEYNHAKTEDGVRFHPHCKVPRLDMKRFLCTPEDRKSEEVLRGIMDGAELFFQERHWAIGKGLWKVLSEDSPDPDERVVDS